MASSPFSPAELAYLEAHRDDSRAAELHWAYSVSLVAGIITTGLRLWAKRYGGTGIALDDYLILLATMFLTAQCIMVLGFGVPQGVGHHVTAVSPHNQMLVRMGDYVFSHFYDLALVNIKLGILALYYRVFVFPIFRRIVLALSALVIAWGVGITVTLLLACRPLAAYWNSRVAGQCLQMVTFTYFTNIFNLATDVIIFILPVPMIWHLQLQTKKKLMLSFIFCLGLATCVISSIRLTIILGRRNPDFTWFYVPLAAYSILEPLGGILCTNLPIICHMIRKHRARLTSLSDPRTRDHSNTNPTIGSRRQRFAIALGLSTPDQTRNDSANATGRAPESPATGEWHRLDDLETQKSDSNIWSTAKKIDSAVSEEGTMDASAKPSTKKTIWNVRT